MADGAGREGFSLDDFVRANRELLTALAFLAGAAQVFLFGFYLPAQADRARGLAALGARLQSERAADRQAQATRAAGQQVPDTPVILQTLHRLAAGAAVELTGVEPSGEERAFTLQLVARFPELLAYVVQLESNNFGIVSMSLGSETTDPGDPPRHRATLVLEPQGPLEAVTGGRLAALIARAGAPALRNPFQQTGSDTAVAVQDEIDLSWTHQLTAISRFGDRRIATIDDFDYQVGDEIDGRRIRRIADDAVYLDAVSGEARFVIGFRQAR